MKRTDIPAFLKKMKDIFTQQLDTIPSHALKKKTRGDMEAGFSDGVRMAVQQLAEDGHLPLDQGDMYTILLIAVNSGGQTFTLSRQTTTDDLATLYNYMKKEGKVSDEEVDTLLLWERGAHYPIVKHMWRAENGDFEDL